MAKKKSSWTPFLVIIGIIAVIGLFVYISTGTSTEIDASQYNYTDDMIENPSASVTVTEFGDFQCPACGQFYSTAKAIKQDYDVNFEYRHFPLRSIHPYAQLAAEASECARDQNRFWAYHDVLYEHQNNLARSSLMDYAQGLGLDMESFETCLETREKQVIVEEDFQAGQQMGVQGTPTVFVEGENVQSSYVAIAAAIEDAR